MIISFADDGDNLMYIGESSKPWIVGIDGKCAQVTEDISAVAPIMQLVNSDAAGVCRSERLLHCSQKVGLVVFERKEIIAPFFRICLADSGLVFPASAVTILPVRSCLSSRSRAVGASPRSRRHAAWSTTTPTSGRYNDTSLGISPWSSMAPQTTFPSRAMTVLVVLIPHAPSHSTAMHSNSAGSISCRQ